jgi:hypothetical protein
VDFPPGSGSAPGQTAGAGSRAGTACVTTHPNPTLAALIPDDPISLTVSTSPTFFVYIPPNTAEEGVFSLSLNPDSYGNYSEKVILSGEPGVIEIPLPQEVGLTPGQDYDWKFSLMCGGTAGAVVQGRIKPMELEPGLQTQLAQTEEGSIARAQVYANHQIWHEATEILYDLRGNTPQEWTEWLDSAGLSDLSQQPSAVEGSPTLF